MKLLIDTSLLVDYLRGGEISERFLETPGQDFELFIPTIVIYELYAGHSTLQDENSLYLMDLLKYFKQVDLTASIARRAGELLRDTQAKIEAQDYIVAATALELNAQVVTLNKKHFSQIPNLLLYPLC